MLLRNSISNTKKFFQKTLDNVKSLISKGGTYERLPKTPPFHPFSCGRDTNDQKKMDGDTGYNNNNTNNNNELDHFYNAFTHQWDNNSRSKSSKVKNKVQKLKSSVRTTKKSHQQIFSFDHPRQKENCNNINKNHAVTTADSLKISDINDDCHQKQNTAGNADILKYNKRFDLSPVKMKLSDLCSRSVREKRLTFVAEKLKELEGMDKGNTEHKRDVEEFLQYYSRLTCPAYLDIVDKFLKEMCAEFFGPLQTASPNKVKGSKPPVWKAVKI